MDEPTISPTHTIDPSSLPSIFQQPSQSTPFATDNPPFALTPTDHHLLSLTDTQFTPHSWPSLHHLISTNQLEKLTRWPSSLRAYLAWTSHVKEKYGSVTTYLLEQRLFWHPLEDQRGALKFSVQNPTLFSHPSDYQILRNDWPYAFEPGVSHIVVWLKQRLPVDAEGALSEEGRRMVEDFVRREFRERAQEEKEGSKVLWFKNATDLQSVRGLEHVHVLVRGVGEEVLERWMR